MLKKKGRVTVFLTVLFGVMLLISTQTGELRADSAWEAKYWKNRTLSGDPVLQRQENELNHDWGDNGPALEVGDDDFSARWRKTINVSAGTYRFTATMDDGMRVWVDGTLIINSWYDSQVHPVSADIYLSAGDHQVTVEYYEAGGGAVAKLTWALVGTPSFTNWRGEYYNNMNLSGAPVAVRDDAQIDFDWGSASPISGIVSADQFSARWTRNISLNPGRYRFTVTADDGVRLWVNNRLVIDQWHDSVSTAYSADVDVAGGVVPVKVEYYERGGGAIIRLSWAATGGTGGPITDTGTWRGEYFNNKDLSGAPSQIRNDAQIDFNWGNGSPSAGINVDNFSVRWTRNLNLNSGRYRFTAGVDDGVRVWVNGQLIIDRWYDHSVQSFSGEVAVAGGPIPVRVEYYENTGLAEIHLSWTATNGTTPPDNSSPTATVVNAYALNVRSGPGVGNSIITTIRRGTIVTLAGYRNPASTWVKVILPNGTQGWVNAYYLSSSYPFSNLIVVNG